MEKEIKENLNCEIKRSGNKLTITVDLSKEGIPSFSGKSLVIASTKGNKALPSEPADNGSIFIGLNVYKKKAKV